MILQYDLPGNIMSCIVLEGDERIYYSVPFDIDRDGTWLKNSYLVVSTRHIWVIRQGELEEKLAIEDCSDFKAEPKVGGGLLTLRYKGTWRYIVHYSASHLARYAYVARGLHILGTGRLEEVSSKEYEHICPKCKRAIPGTRQCPHCTKSGGFWKHFIPIVRPYKKQLAQIIITMLIAVTTALLYPQIQKYLVDDVLTDRRGTMGMALGFLALMALLSAGRVMNDICKSYFCTILGATIAKDMRKKLFEKIQLLSISFINDRRPGDLMNRVVSDTDRIREFMENTFCNLFTVSFIFVCNIIFMLILNVRLALLSFAFLPVVAIAIGVFRNDIHRRFHLQRAKGDDVNSNLQDVISGMRVVKSYGKESAEEKKFNHLAEIFCRVQRKNEVFWALFMPMTRFVMGGGIILVIYYGGLDVLGGRTTAGELLQFYIYTESIYRYLQWMTSLPRDLTNLISSLERINDVLCQEPTIADADHPVSLDIDGKIEFKDATFGYKSYQPVLEKLNLQIKKGEMIGIVGASGAGKSTLINLIMRLYEVDDGKLLIDGQDIKNIKSDKYHSQLGVVLQESFLFSGTILDNIRFARPDATYEEVIYAAKMANAHEFIIKTQDGYNTYVGEKGYALSGGERQRIAIARAILNQPRLLILDEATASLDTESEFMIQKALQRLTKGRTTFAIAHRLSTLQNADRLLVIDGHQIAEIGTHEELIRKHGIYYHLVAAQLAMQKTANDSV